jgi:hypothetical protein
MIRKVRENGAKLNSVRILAGGEAFPERGIHSARSFLALPHAE